jgi:hypothetical protein
MINIIKSINSIINYTIENVKFLNYFKSKENVENNNDIFDKLNNIV